MAVKRITSLLLAASVVVCGFSIGYINKPAQAVTRVDELSDVSSHTWAYDALKDLVTKYNVIEGYPDKTFRGSKHANRYELAAALNATIKTIGKEIARLGAEKADKEDLATVAKLQQEFATELNTLQARATALEARATKIESKNDEQDNRLAILEKMKIYGDVNFGGYADISGNPGNEFSDSITSVGRTRINFDYPVIEDKGGKIVGPGTIHSRLVAAFGRVSPLESDSTIARNRYSGASRIAADSSFYNEGIRPNDLINLTNGTGFGDSGMISGANTRANAYIDSAYYSQVLRTNTPLLPKGEDWKSSFTLHMGLIPWRDIFYKTPYQGREGTQFQNTALINNPAILTDNNVPRLAGVFNQGLGKWANLSLKLDGSFMDISYLTNGVGMTAEADIAYNLGFLDKKFGTNDIFNIGGNLFGGYYLVDSNNGGLNNLLTVTTGLAGPVAGQTPTNGSIASTAHGFYGGLNQELYKGIGMFGSFALNNTNPLAALLYALQNGNGSNVMLNNSLLAGSPLLYGVKMSWTAGGEIPIRALPKAITFGKRQRDVFGAAVAFIFPNDATGSPASIGTTVPAGVVNGAARAREKVIEAYYKLQITDSFSFIPSAQIIWDRMASRANDVDVVIGLRSNFVF